MGIKYGHPQPAITRRMGDLETLSCEGDVFIKFLPTGLREPWGKETERVLRAREDGRHQENKVL